jgi:hypothetical protein
MYTVAHPAQHKFRTGMLKRPRLPTTLPAVAPHSGQQTSSVAAGISRSMHGRQQHVFHVGAPETRGNGARKSVVPTVNALAPAKLLTPRQSFDGAILPA